jgi:hypothetical protein
MPRHFKRLIKTYQTSMGTPEVMTDAGRAYLKTMGSKEGPHPLASEWVATHLAKWFGLPTFDVAIIMMDKNDSYPLPKGYRVEPGPAFAARAVDGHPWGGDGTELLQLINVDHITWLVIFDNWVLNCDRYPPDLEQRKPNYGNVCLAETGARGRLRLLAMDQTHCFNCGRDWTPELAHDRWMKDERLYGLFPQFVSLLRRDAAEAAAARLSEMSHDVATAVIPAISPEWQVSPAAQVAMMELVSRRAALVADRILDQLPFGLGA